MEEERESPCGIVTKVEGGFQSCENIKPDLEAGSHRDLGDQGAASRGRGFCPLSDCVEEERDLVTARSSSLTFFPREGGVLAPQPSLSGDQGSCPVRPSWAGDCVTSEIGTVARTAA